MKNAFFYFVFFPFLGLINAIKNYRSSWAKPTLISFVAFFAMSMVKSDAVDSSRYVERLKEMYSTNQTFDTFKDSFYNETDGEPDVYIGLITYIFSLFTDNGNLFFLFLGFVFGYFYVNNIWLVLNLSVGRLSWIQILVLLSFSFVLGFWQVTGVRMNTATHVFFYGAFLYLYHNNKKGLIIASLSFLIHFALILPIILFLVYVLVRLNFRFLYFIYLASFFVLELNVGLIRTFLESNVPDFLLPKVKSYLNDEYVEVVSNQFQVANWYLTYYQKAISYFTFIIITLLFLKSNLSTNVKKLFGFSLLILAVGNITSLLPSGGRYLTIAMLFSMALIFIVVANNNDVLLNKRVKLLSPLLILFCIVSIRTSLDFFNITTLTNPIVVLLTDINKPLIEFIK